VYALKGIAEFIGVQNTKMSRAIKKSSGKMKSDIARSDLTMFYNASFVDAQ